jgi:H+/gluconate symporter-like permease
MAAETQLVVAAGMPEHMEVRKRRSGAVLPPVGLIRALIGIPFALHVSASAAGATIASHVNDSGFWLVNRYLGLTVPETFKTWTALTTIAALVSIVLVMLAAALL